MIDTAPDAIITIESDGPSPQLQPCLRRQFGYLSAEVIGQNVTLLMPEPYRTEHDGYLQRYLTTGEKRIIGIGRTVIARHKSGRTFPIELAVGEVKSGESHIFTGFIRDISERVAAQAEGATIAEVVGDRMAAAHRSRRACGRAEERARPLQHLGESQGKERVYRLE